jgi:predicted ATPase/transcriptional regulator with XRE-family HTH domain
MITTGSDDPFSFGKWLKERREALDYTQGELALAVGCSVSAIRKMEAGVRRPSKQMAELLATQLQISPRDRPLFLQFAREVTATGTKGRPTPTGLPARERPSARTTAAPSSSSSPSAPARYSVSATETPEQARPDTAWGSPPDNLPAYLTSFVGRTEALEQVRSILWKTEVRLLTLTGPGGVGKTRLAVEAASSLLHDFADGVFFVPLAMIQDPGAVLTAVAATLAVRESPGKPVATALADYLRRKNILLVLDNFEQVLDAALPLVDLLKNAPRLKMLVTSREPLHVYGEHELSLPPMAVPLVPNDQEPPPDDQPLTAVESVQLFVRRVQAVRPDFRVSDTNIDIVGSICRELDGLPLAIELAAARCKYMPLEAIHRRLQEGLGLLAGGPRDMPARHQTMRTAIEWSYDLLTPEDQALFRSLAVFAGGFTAEAAAAVAPEDAGVVTYERLLSLVGKSLLVMRKAQPDRFWKLVTLHEYALEQLVRAGESDATHARHAAFYVALVEHDKPHPTGSGTRAWLDLVQTERANLQVALDWLLARLQNNHALEEAELALRLTLVLSSFLRARGQFTEWRGVRVATLQATAAVTARSGDDAEGKRLKSLRAGVMEALGKAAWAQADFRVVQQCFEESLALYRQAEDKPGVARLINDFGSLACDRADYQTALKLSQESLALAIEAGDRTLTAGVHNNIANIYRNLNDLPTARGYYEQSLALYRELGNKSDTCTPLSNLGLISMDLDDYAGARRYLEETIAIARELGNKNDLAYGLAFMWKCAVEVKDYAQAQVLKAECLPLVHQLDYKPVLTGCFETEASMRETLGKPLEAARLWGATEALREAINFPLPLPARVRYDRYVASARAQSRPADFEQAWAEGRAMPVEAAIRYALGEPISTRVTSDQ